MDVGNPEAPAEAPTEGPSESKVEPEKSPAPPAAAPAGDETAAPGQDAPPAEGELLSSSFYTVSHSFGPLFSTPCCSFYYYFRVELFQKFQKHPSLFDVLHFSLVSF